MKKRYLLVLSLATLAACTSPSPANPGQTDSVKHIATVQPKENAVTNPLADTIKVKDWLTKVITDYTSSDTASNKFDELRKNLTDNYYHYKQDALNMQYDSDEAPLTEEGFKKKWAGKFNTKYVGDGGFIISGQDNGKIQVSMHLIKQIDEQASLYKVAINDLDFKITYNRDIKVITQNGKLLIADILEYN